MRSRERLAGWLLAQDHLLVTEIDRIGRIRLASTNAGAGESVRIFAKLGFEEFGQPAGFEFPRWIFLPHYRPFSRYGQVLGSPLWLRSSCGRAEETTGIAKLIFLSNRRQCRCGSMHAKCRRLVPARRAALALQLLQGCLLIG